MLDDDAASFGVLVGVPWAALEADEHVLGSDIENAAAAHTLLLLLQLHCNHPSYQRHLMVEGMGSCYLLLLLPCPYLQRKMKRDLLLLLPAAAALDETSCLSYHYHYHYLQR